MGFLDKLIKSVTNEAERDAKRAANQAVGNAVNDALGGLFGTSRPAGTQNTPPSGQGQQYTAPSAAPAYAEETVDPMYFDDGRPVAAKLREVLASDFAAFTVRENVSPTEIGGTGKFLNYTYGVYAGGAPRLFIVVGGKSEFGRRTYRWSKQQAAAAGVPLINFWVAEPNSVPYITQRLHKYLG
ncbi:MAG: hypothetical protein IIZ35_03695 [Clostridia bacterium]|nr:hypothetical protein [Clostridia bacterium]